MKQPAFQQVDVPVRQIAESRFEIPGDGLNVSHDVGIWNSSGTLLASTTVAAGTVDPIQGGYRYAAISDLPLTAGDIYYVGSVNGIDDDGWLQDPSSLLAAPEITYLSRQFEFSSGALVFPDLQGSGGTGYFGGNFLFSDSNSQVPEPATLALLGLGLAGLSFSRRKQ